MLNWHHKSCTTQLPFVTPPHLFYLNIFTPTLPWPSPPSFCIHSKTSFHPILVPFISGSSTAAFINLRHAPLLFKLDTCIFTGLWQCAPSDLLAQGYNGLVMKCPLAVMLYPQSWQSDWQHCKTWTATSKWYSTSMNYITIPVNTRSKERRRILDILQANSTEIYWLPKIATSI